MSVRAVSSPLIKAGIVLGVGLGGFLDGIVLHQVLQWHHMLTSGGYPATSIENLQVNMLWDGLFHAVTWVITTVGLVMLWSASRRPNAAWSTHQLWGSLAMGWGVFNLLEGIVNHHILSIHHVREDVPNVLFWDLSFLAVGAALFSIGLVFVRTAHGKAETAGISSRETTDAN